MVHSKSNTRIKQVAIVGAAERMGRWFVHYFSLYASAVCAYDLKPIESTEGRKARVRIAQSLEDCVSNADVTFICVPVVSSPALIQQCSKLVKKDSILCDIASIKKKSFSELSKVRRDIVPLCLHPMFGPGAGHRGLRWIQIPVRDSKVEFTLARSLLKNSHIIAVSSWSEHDRMMGIVLGLTYFINLAFADILSRNDLSLLKRIAGTTFTLQSLLAESIIAEDPSLVSAIISSNSETARNVTEFLRACKLIQKAIPEEKLIREKVLSLNSRLAKSQDFENSYHRMYQIVSSFKQTKN